MDPHRSAMLAGRMLAIKTPEDDASSIFSPLLGGVLDPEPEAATAGV